MLLAAQGIDNDEIALRLDTRREIVSKWRKRFFEERLAGLEERPRQGRPGVFPPRGGRRGQGHRLRASRPPRPPPEPPPRP
ncbi:MAG: helix-turn-helix domain-containing protein [Candidatus Dormibacteria bacterium]